MTKADIFIEIISSWKGPQIEVSSAYKHRDFISMFLTKINCHHVSHSRLKKDFVIFELYLKSMDQFHKIKNYLLKNNIHIEIYQ
jgi:hypothetical protein